MTQRIYLIGYPGDIGGACTEAWHTIRLWRQFGAEVHLVPTWGASPAWRARCDAIGCVTHETSAAAVHRVDGLPGSTCVSMCNANFLAVADRLRAVGCRIAWVNCMTWLFPAETKIYRRGGAFEAYVFQSEFQRGLIEPALVKYGYTADRGHLIRGAFDAAAWQFAPRPHASGEPYVVGRMARPDRDKWS